MQIPRIYQECEITENAKVELDQRASHYLINVLRLSADHPVILFNGRGGEFVAHILKIQKKKVFVKIESFSPVSRESNLNIHLIQGISKFDKMDFVIQKATELDVSEITPLITERCNVKLSREREQKRQLRWQQIMVSACEQCGRNKLPILNTIVDFKNIMGTVPFGDSPRSIQAQKKSSGTVPDSFTAPDSFKFILKPNTEKTLKEFQQTPKEITILIGPEGGFTEMEIQTAHLQNFMDLSLGPRILRTETAALTAITALQVRWGDLG